MHHHLIVIIVIAINCYQLQPAVAACQAWPLLPQDDRSRSSDLASRPPAVVCGVWKKSWLRLSDLFMFDYKRVPLASSTSVKCLVFLAQIHISCCLLCPPSPCKSSLSWIAQSWARDTSRAFRRTKGSSSWWEESIVNEAIAELKQLCWVDLLANISCHSSQHKGAKAKDLEAFDQYKGRVAPPKRMNFRKSSNRPLTPPLSFGKSSSKSPV